jgi:rhodanese-related sulfurtransferase
MGVGFVVSGYCPGTSFCGAAIGRIDGMLFVLGGLVGAFGFAEAYPRVQRLYLASSFGDLTVPAVLGIPPGVFAMLMIVMAVAAFGVTTRIERRVNPAAPARAYRVRAHRLAAVALVCAGIAAAATPDYKDRLLARASRESDRGTQPIARVSADELAFRLLDGDASLVVVDVRPSAAFAASSLPGAVSIPANDLFATASKDVLGRATRKIFVADDEAQARTAASLALLLGYRNVGVLEDGLTGFTRSILAARKPSGAAGEDDVAEFRAEAATRLTAMMAARRAPKPTPRTVKKIAGGCGV